MTAELVERSDVSMKKKTHETTHQRTLFPEPAKETKSHQRIQLGGIGRRTLAMDPQQGAGRLPHLEKTSPEEPLCCPLVLSAAKDNMICGWIGRREPPPEVLSPLVPCRNISASISNKSRSYGDHERFTSSTLLSMSCIIALDSRAVCCTTTLVSFPSGHINVRNGICRKSA